MELTTELKSRIEAALSKKPICLFMKGTPAFPQCGFSQRAIALLNEVEADFHAVNVLEDQEIRDGIKVFGNWPTIPQLYKDGKLLGGSDILMEMYQEGELEAALVTGPVSGNKESQASKLPYTFGRSSQFKQSVSYYRTCILVFMARHKTILQNKFPYHISARCINKDWFTLPMEQVWKVFSEELYISSHIHNFKIHSFVLMSNHYHLIASTPDKNLSKCMHRFSYKVSRRLTRMGNRINQTFAGRYFKTIITQPNYFLNVYKYNYRNPVEAGICNEVQHYPYSSLNAILGGSKLEFPIVHDDTLFDDIHETLKWLNTKPTLQHLDAVKCGLKKSIFEPKKDQNNKPILSDHQLL